MKSPRFFSVITRMANLTIKQEKNIDNNECVLTKSFVTCLLTMRKHTDRLNRVFLFLIDHFLLLGYQSC